MNSSLSANTPKSVLRATKTVAVLASACLALAGIGQAESADVGSIEAQSVETKPSNASATATPAKAATTRALAETGPAVDFAKALTGRATEILTDKSLSEQEQLEKFEVVLTEALALDVIGRFMIGETRKSMTTDQSARYDSIFPRYLTALYAEQFAEIVGRPLEVVDSKALNARDVVVRTRFTRAEGSPINVDWRIRKLNSGEHKAIDIIVSGVSIMLVKREEFAAFVAQNGVDALLARLETEIA